MRLAGLFILLSLFITSAYAEIADELLELDAEYLGELAWRDFYRELGTLGDSLKLDTRLRLGYSESYSLHTALWEHAGHRLLLNLRHDFDDSLDLLNYSLLLKSRKLELNLGSHRFRFGRGILSGNGSRALPKNVFGLYTPTSPTQYAPLGVAVLARRKSFRAVAFGSVQQRGVILSGEDIHSLPSSRDQRLGRSRETIFGAALGFDAGALLAGALLWHQDYDRGFADPDLKSALWAVSVYGSHTRGVNRLDAEVAWQEGDWHQLLSWNFKHKKFNQQLSYASNPSYRQYPYALSPSVLNRFAHRREYAYDASLQLAKSLRLQLRYSLNHGTDFEQDHLSRFLTSLDYRHQSGSVKFSFISFDRELIALVDTAYVSSIPQNHRFNLLFTHQFLPAWEQRLSFGYHFQDKQDYTQNTYRVDLSLSYAWRKLSLRLGWQSWQSPRSYYILDEDSPSYYTVASGDENEIYLSARHQIKHLLLSFGYRQSLLNLKRCQISLRVGLGLF